MTSIEAQLLVAHEAGDQAALVRLYTEAARVVQDEDARGFYLTHAYIFALEAGLAEAKGLQEELIDLGREDPDTFTE
ncbi:MAG: hypothetical protein R8G34_02145 [Paracoccaceae bacterium]|nr:hypothetical protein [Paracoccaceae bacterium]